MPRILNKNKKNVKPAFEQSQDLKKIAMYVTIVNRGQGEAVVKLFQTLKTSLQFIQVGQGTATKQVYDILGMEDNTKEIIVSLVPVDRLPFVRIELEAFFAANRNNKGIGFAIPLTSIIGVSIYKFITNTI